MQASQGWPVYAPTGWRMLTYQRRDGETDLHCQCDAKLTKFETNVPLPDELKEPRFPPLTWVDDDVHNKRYFIMADGRERIMAPFEVRAGVTAEKMNEWVGSGQDVEQKISELAAERERELAHSKR